MSKAKFGKTSLYLEVEKSNVTESTHIILQKKIFDIDKKVYDISYKRKKVLCWWCCHIFDSEIVSFPIRKDSFNKVYVIGIFCSFNCCKSYGVDKNYNHNLFKKYYEFISKGSIRTLKNAPPKETLYCFGGVLTIDEFRKNFIELKNKIELTRYPIIHEIQQIAISKVRKFIDNNYNYTPKKEKPTKKIKKENSLSKLISYV